MSNHAASPLSRLFGAIGRAFLSAAGESEAKSSSDPLSDEEMEKLIRADAYLQRRAEELTTRQKESAIPGKSSNNVATAKWYDSLALAAAKFRREARLSRPAGISPSQRHQSESRLSDKDKNSSWEHDRKEHQNYKLAPVVGACKNQSRELMERLYQIFNELSLGFNTRHERIEEPVVRTTVSDMILGSSQNEDDWHAEFHISTRTRRASITARIGMIHIYLSETAHSVLPEQGLSRANLKLAIESRLLEKSWHWCVYRLPIEDLEICYLMRVLFKDMILLSVADAVLDESGDKFECVRNLRRITERFRAKDSLSLESEPSETLMHDLVLSKENIVHRLLNQQEEIQAEIARELHDSVLADILLLSRRLASEKEIKTEETTKVLEKCGVTIREICRGLVPRDLKDWGLETVIQDLLDKLAERTEADCSLESDEKIPELPPAVQLHIFRIVQECLNNIEKYARAKTVTVSMKTEQDIFSIEIIDDGLGFDPDELSSKSTSTGGLGLRGLKERVEIIKAFYPTRLIIDSRNEEADSGTLIRLELKIWS